MLEVNWDNFLELPGAKMIGREQGRSGCPLHGAGSTVLSVSVLDGKALYKCFDGCEQESLGNMLKEIGVISGGHKNTVQAIKSAPKIKDTAAAKRIWKDSVAIKGTPADKYLSGRKINIDAMGHELWNLRWNKEKSAMIALVQNNGWGCGISKTYDLSNSEGVQRRFNGNVKGGVICLLKHDGSDTICVAEGIETALSYAILTRKVVWSVMSTSGMKAFNLHNLPKGVKSLIIAADNDGPGLEAAGVLKHRAKEAGLSVEIDRPAGDEFHKLDFNDIL